MSNFEGPRLIRREDFPGSRRLIEASFGQSWEVDDSNSPFTGETWLMTSDGQPVSQISIFWTELAVENATITIGAVGGVCTHPDFRGYGLASRLMKQCTLRLAREDATLMLISGGRGLYTRLGAVPAGRLAAFTLQPDALPPLRSQYTIRPARPEDAAVCASLYQAEPVHFKRKLALIEDRIRSSRGGPSEEAFYMVEQAGASASVAYFWLSPAWNEPEEPELDGTRGLLEYAGSREALAGALPQAANLLRPRALRVWVPWQDTALIQLLQQLLPSSDPAVRPPWCTLDGHTLRILDLVEMMHIMQPYLEARLAPPMLSALQFGQVGPLLGDAGGDTCTISLGEDRLTLDVASMTRLVFGADTDPDLSAASPALRDVLQTIFPLPSFLPGLDYH